MDTTDPLITFDNNGVCSHCHNYDRIIKTVSDADQKEKELKRIVYWVYLAE